MKTKFKYSINKNNYINYELFENFVLVRSIFFDDIGLLKNSIKTYIDFFSTIDGADFLGAYPGTTNPLVVRYVLDYIVDKNFNYRIFYDGSEVPSIQAFEKTKLKQAVDQALKVSSPSILQSACEGAVVISCANSGFMKCCVFSPLKINYNYIRTPIKYYELDSNNFIVNEFSEIPDINKTYYKSIRLAPMFTSRVIRIENGKPVYYGNK